MIMPVIPEVPASAVRRSKSPLEEVVPVPEEIVTLPPVPETAAVDVPALMRSSPPVPLLPVPTVTYT
jgi:hypothetical protein